MSVKMVNDVPSSMQEPANAYEAIGADALVGAVSHERGEGELPLTQASAEVGGAGAGDHDCREVSSVRLFEERGKKDEE